MTYEQLTPEPRQRPRPSGPTADGPETAAARARPFAARILTRREVMRSGGLLIAALLGLGVAGCGLGGPAYGPVAADVAVAIEMTNALEFSPANVTIRVGDVIEWRNKSLFTHTVTAEPGLAKDPEHLMLPEGASPFNSGGIAPGEVFRFVFQAPGRYRYFCVPHEDQDMLGAIEVIPAA